MGGLIKLVGILGTFLVSYAILSLLLVYIGLLPLLLGLNPDAQSPYSALLGYALVVVSAALVLTFFTTPVTLSIFERPPSRIREGARLGRVDHD